MRQILVFQYAQEWISNLRSHTTSRRVVCLLLILAALLFLTGLPAHSQANGSLQVSYINVGQGDSALLRDSAGFDVLIDGGPPAAGPTVIAYLKQSQMDDLDVLVASHPDSDHIGGLVAVLKDTEIPIEAVVYNGYPGTTLLWGDFLAAADARGLVPTVAVFPEEFSWGQMSVQVLNPPAGLSNPSTNSASLVLRLGLGTVYFLFTGDIDSTVEASVVARQTPVSAQILKVAHHGSSGSSSSAFLSASSPLESIISVGKNEYSQPGVDALARLQASGARIFRTDQLGTVRILTDGDSYTVRFQFSYRAFMPLIAGPSAD